MKVLMICGFYPSASALTEGVFIHNQVKALEHLKKKGQKVDIDILLLDLRSIRRKRPIGYSEYEYDDIIVKRYSIPYGPIFGLSFVLRLAAAIGFDKYIKKYGKPDIIHTHFFGISKVGCEIKRRYQIPLVMTEHSSGIMKVDKQARLREYRNVYEYADYIISVGNILKRKIGEFTHHEVDVIPNIVPDYFFEIDLNNNKPEVFRFISVGALIKLKRFDLTIKAFKKFNNAVPNSELLIVGKGPLENELRGLTEAVGLSKRIIFKGTVLNKDLPELYASSDCFILPSNSETFGMVYAEAAAVGIPVIATKCGGSEDIVNPNNGLLIPLNDVDSLYCAMKEIYENRGKYNSSMISSEIKRKFSEAVVGRRLAEVYTEVLNKGKYS